MEDILDTAVVNDKVSKLMNEHLLSEDVKRLSKKTVVTVLDPRPEAIKEVIRTKIFSTIESTMKDYLMLSIHAFNQILIGSRLITVGIWLIRARILGKDLGISQLASTGMSNVHVRNIQGHRNYQFLGEGAAYLGLDELTRTLFYLFTGINQASLLNFPMNVGISCLAYKFAIVSTYTRTINLCDSDWSEEGINFDTFYRPLTIDPLLNRMAAVINQRYQQNKVLNNLAGDQKHEIEEQTIATHLKEKEGLFWDDLYQRRLTNAERAFLEIHAENLIFILSAFKQSRASGAEYLIKFLAMLFPKPIQNIMKVGLEELTDERIDLMITFLLVNKKSNLIKKSEITNEDRWVFLEDKSKPVVKKTKRVPPIYLEDTAELEPVDITPQEINAVHAAVAKTLKCHKSGIIDVRSINEQENPDQVFMAEVQHQYDSITDENEARDNIAAIQSPTERLFESFSLPVRQFILNYQKAREAGASTTGFMMDEGSKTIIAITQKIDTIPGGKTTLKIASSVVGGPTTVLAVLADAADNAGAIQTCASMVGNLVEGLNARVSNSGNNQDENQPGSNREALEVKSSGNISEDRNVSKEETAQNSEKDNLQRSPSYIQQFKDYVCNTAAFYWGKTGGNENQPIPESNKLKVS